MAELMSRLKKMERHEWQKMTNTSQPFFIYDCKQICNNIIKLRKLLSSLTNRPKILFSFKANPNIHLIEFLSKNVDGFDVSSLLELEAIKKLGISGKSVTFSGPGKTDEGLRFACQWPISTIHIDSVDEYRVLRESGAVKPQLSLRLQVPDRGAQKLGLADEDLKDILNECDKPIFHGLHAYLGRESFSSERFSNLIKEMWEWKNQYPHAFHSDFTAFVGPGLPALECEKDWNLEIASNLNFPFPIHFELGRALMASAGFYAAPVLTQKRTSGGRQLVIVNGGVHHLGSPIVSVYNKGQILESLFIRENILLPLNKKKEASLYGSLCLWHDCLHPRLEFPHDLQRGDWLVVSHCGAYGVTAAVPFFIGQDLPREFAFFPGKGVVDITPETFDTYHNSFHNI